MFVLPFHIPPNSESIQLKQSIFSIGSCFADNIGSKLAAHKFDVQINPLGTIYNPYSIFRNLRTLSGEGLDPIHCIQREDIHYHWDAHSALSDIDFDRFQQRLKERSSTIKAELMRCEWLLITVGTAKVYRFNHTDQVVANCHKIPAKEFTQEYLSVENIVSDYESTLKTIRQLNPGIKTILTVSPVRHIRDGLIENNYSKGILLQAVRQIVSNDEHSSYFPAYELMIDVLRDYRFYESDMIHPNAQAIDYIWQRFVETYFDDKMRAFIAKWAQLKKSLDHRPFHPKARAHQAFIRSTIKQLESFGDKIDITAELNQLKKQLV